MLGSVPVAVFVGPIKELSTRVQYFEVLIQENNLTKADHTLIKCNLINHVESYFVQTLTNS